MTREERFFARYTDNKEILTEWLKRAQKGEPLTRIVGERHFWDRAFLINEHVLDPRPESETLIEGVLKTYPDNSLPLRFLDLGTGSGCLLITLLEEYPHATGLGVDISPDALQVARHNGAFLKNRISFRQGSWWEPVQNEAFDVVISNPPYIGLNEPLDKSVIDYDPHIALFAGKDGLLAYHALFLKLKTVGFFEIGYKQDREVSALAEYYGLTVIERYKDLLGFVRILKITNEMS